jgi:hypothetical protein
MIKGRLSKRGIPVVGNLSSMERWNASFSSFLFPALLPLLMQAVRQWSVGTGAQAVEGRIDPGRGAVMAVSRMEAKPWWEAESISIQQGDWWRDQLTIETSRMQSGITEFQQEIRRLILTAMRVASGKEGM